ncbi:hypothetical protein M9Y10_002148 [Tritrichomonas musculus]|uniref:Uncharacterized protein n=1 Tax=Tritrichomonas musculus TaxID=1915356 RepID=A0ABR2LA10_9EUKA
MSYFWLCCDPEPAKNLKNLKVEQKNQTLRASSHFLGIFTDDPDNLGRMCPRPTTPFNNEPSSIPSAFENESKGITASIVCESPPASMAFEFSDVRNRVSPQCLISIF